MTTKNRRNDSQATKDFWNKIRSEDRIADLKGAGYDDDAIRAMLREDCPNCHSRSHSFCNR